MFPEAKLTFAAWTGLGITATTIGTVVYQRSSGFGISNKENSEKGDKLIKRLDLGDQKDTKEQKVPSKKEPLTTKPEEDLDSSKKDTQEKPKEDFEVSKNQNLKEPEENADESLGHKNIQEEDQESSSDGMQSYTFDDEEDEEPRLIAS